VLKTRLSRNTVSTLFETFAARAQAASAEVHRFPTRAEALDFVLGFVGTLEGDRLQPSFAVWADCPFLRGLDGPALIERTPGLTFQVTRGSASTATVGISQVDFAIADTGTLVQNATAVEQRMVSMLPPVHVAIVETGSIVADLRAALSRFSPREGGGAGSLPPYLAFITGPSRTADIERVLTIGVHGPGRLIVVCVDEPCLKDERGGQ
jgi:L-lactate dehydrogenase complex protein LldG